MKTRIIFHIGFVGDSILSLPIQAAIQKKYPGDRLIRVANSAMKPFLENCPYFDDIIYFDSKAPRGQAVKSLWNTLRQFRPESFINLHTPDGGRRLKHYFRDASFAQSLGACEQFAYVKGPEAFLVSHPTSIRRFGHRSMLEEMADIVRSLELNIKPDCCTLWLDEAHRYVASAQLASLKNRRFIAISPFGKRRCKELPPAELVAGIRELVSFENAPAVFLGGPNDLPQMQLIEKFIDFEYLDLVGKNSLLEAGAIFEQATLTLAIDSGLAHLANLVNCPTIVLFGPMPPDRWSPMKKKGLAVFRGKTQFDSAEFEEERLRLYPYPFRWEEIRNTARYMMLRSKKQAGSIL